MCLKNNHYRETTFPPDAPRSSQRRNPLGMSASSWSRARREAHLHPYVMRTRQELKPEDLPRRLSMCQWFLQQPPEFFETLIMSDEARKGSTV